MCPDFLDTLICVQTLWASLVFGYIAKLVFNTCRIRLSDFTVTDS